MRHREKRPLVHGTVALAACVLLAQLQAPATRPAGRLGAAGPFTDWLAEIATMPPGARAAAIEARITDAGGTPLVDGRRVLFLVRGVATDPPRIVGDFNAWGWTPEGFDGNAGAMQPIDGTGWFWLHVELLPAARIEYQIARGRDRFATDPNNPKTVEGFGGLSSELRLAGHPRVPEVEEAPRSRAGRVESHRFTSRILRNDRAVHVYLPAGTGADQRLPVAYFGDGTAYLERALVPRILDYAIGRGALPPLLAVLVDPVDRRDEYGMNADYRRFIADELIPFIDDRYPTLVGPAGRVVVGGSRGGMMALDLALARDELFGGVVAFAPATLPHDLVTPIRTMPRKDVRVFILAGLYDARWLPDARALRDALTAKGYTLTYREIPEGHNIPAWRAWIDDGLAAVMSTADGSRTGRSP